MVHRGLMRAVDGSTIGTELYQSLAPGQAKAGASGGANMSTVTSVIRKVGRSYVSQATKCMWWMPRRSQAMKDAAALRKLRGAGKQSIDPQMSE